MGPIASACKTGKISRLPSKGVTICMKTVSKIYLALIFLFLYAPIFVLIFFSFNATNSTSLFAGFSLRWYESQIGRAHV